jgi:hypothetical protein
MPHSGCEKLSKIISKKYIIFLHQSYRPPVNTNSLSTSEKNGKYSRHNGTRQGE